MKLFRLECPVCRRRYSIESRDVTHFNDNHVLQCGRARHSVRAASTLAERLAHFLDRLRGGRISARDALLLKGRALLQLFRDGELLDVRLTPNLVVDTGRAFVIDRVQAASPAVCDYQAVGTNNTAANAADTTLNTEIGTRVQGTLSQPTAYTDRLVSTFAAANGTGALVETGRLNASSSGTLYTRLVFAVINKGASDSLQITHDVTD